MSDLKAFLEAREAKKAREAVKDPFLVEEVKEVKVEAVVKQEVEDPFKVEEEVEKVNAGVKEEKVKVPAQVVPVVPAVNTAQAPTVPAQQLSVYDNFFLETKKSMESFNKKYSSDLTSFHYNPDVYKTDGKLKAIQTEIIEGASKSYLPAVVLTSLSFVSFYAGLRYYSKKAGLLPNLYTLALGESGFGKNSGKNFANKVASNTASLGQTCHRPGSYQGVGELFQGGQVWLINDEFDKFLGDLRTKEGQANGILAAFLDWFDAQSACKLGSDTKGKKALIGFPYLSITGFCSQEVFMSQMGDEMVNSGFLTRFLFVPPCYGVSYNGISDVSYPKSTLLAEQLSKAEIPRNQFGSIEIEKMIDVDFTDEAYDFYQKRKNQMDKLLKKVDPKTSRIVNRRHVLTTKIAMLKAISENVEKPLVTLDMILWAERISRLSTKFALASIKGRDVSEWDISMEKIKNKFVEKYYDGSGATLNDIFQQVKSKSLSLKACESSLQGLQRLDILTAVKVNEKIKYSLNLSSDLVKSELAQRRKKNKK